MHQVYPTANIVATPNPHQAVLQGAYTFSASSLFPNNCIYRHDYLAAHPETHILSLEEILPFHLP